MTILDKIVARKREEVTLLRREGFFQPDSPVAPPRGFKNALLANDKVAIIAELKKASPSKGLLCPDFEPCTIAKEYEGGGAACISVLTDQDFFQGDIKYIPQVRDAVPLPVLRKDFIIDHLQIEETAAAGADALLLIAAVLDNVLMSELISHGGEKEMDVLVEVHDERELERALEAGANLLGINNRNLKDFSVSLATTFRLKERVPDGVPVVSESGISSREDILALEEKGIAAALIGEALITAEDRCRKLEELRGIT